MYYYHLFHSFCSIGIRIHVAWECEFYELILRRYEPHKIDSVRGAIDDSIIVLIIHKPFSLSNNIEHIIIVQLVSIMTPLLFQPHALSFGIMYQARDVASNSEWLVFNSLSTNGTPA